MKDTTMFPVDPQHIENAIHNNASFIADVVTTRNYGLNYIIPEGHTFRTASEAYDYVCARLTQEGFIGRKVEKVIITDATDEEYNLVTMSVREIVNLRKIIELEIPMYGMNVTKREHLREQLEQINTYLAWGRKNVE